MSLMLREDILLNKSNKTLNKIGLVSDYKINLTKQTQITYFESLFSFIYTTILLKLGWKLLFTKIKLQLKIL